MTIKVEDIVEHDNGSATFTFAGSKEDMEAFKTAMFNNFIINAIKLTKEENVKILDDLNDHWTQITYDDYDKIENKVIQAQGIINVAMDAYCGSEYEDLSGALWAVSDPLKDISKILGGNLAPVSLEE